MSVITTPQGRGLMQSTDARYGRAIERAMELRANGVSFDGIARILNTEGFRMRTGKWYGQAIRSILITRM